MFLNTNDRIINLKNVSNINILKDRNRIIFNLNYNIVISTDREDQSKQISDYVYWDAINSEDLKGNLEHLGKSKYFKENFIKQIDGHGFINKNEISSIKLSEKKYRVIFNLSHPVTFRDNQGVERITSEFVYINCRNPQKYKEYVNYVQSEIGE